MMDYPMRLSDDPLRKPEKEGEKKLVLFESNALGTCTLPAWGDAASCISL